MGGGLVISPWAVSWGSGSVSAGLPGILAAPALLVGGGVWAITGLGGGGCIISLLPVKLLVNIGPKEDLAGMPTNLATGTSIVVHCVAFWVVQVPWNRLWSRGASVPGILGSWLSLVISAPWAPISFIPQAVAYFMLGTGWACCLSFLLSSVLSGAGGSSPVLGAAAGQLVWPGWDVPLLVWPGWDVLAVWLGWVGLVPGLAGLSGSVPVGGQALLEVSGLLVWSGWDGLFSASVWSGWDVPLSVRVGWGGLMPGLAGLAGVVSAPVGE